MNAAQMDTERAKAAVKAIIGDRAFEDSAAIMVTAEHAIATLLIVLYRDPAMAAAMLNEALVPRVEERIALFPTHHDPRGANPTRGAS